VHDTRGKALVAVARKMLVTIYHVLDHHSQYRGLRPELFEKRLGDSNESHNQAYKLMNESANPHQNENTRPEENLHWCGGRDLNPFVRNPLV